MGVRGALFGFFSALGLGLGLWFLLFFIDMLIIGNFIFMPLHGLIQWAYLIPMARKYKQKGESGKAAGLFIGGGIIFLLMSACFGMIFLTWGGVL